MRGKTMRKRSSKTILVFFALGLIGCALCVQQAQAVRVTGAITFGGGVELDRSSVDTATTVTGWLDQSGLMPTVTSASGSFAAHVTIGDTATFSSPWPFSSGPIPSFWTVDGFTFDLVTSNVLSQGGGFVNVYGTGFISGWGLGPTQGSWNFTAQDPGSGDPPVFSFSGSTQATPDGGATVVLLGLALVGIEGIRRKLF